MKKISELIYQQLHLQLDHDCSIAGQIANHIRWLIVSKQINPNDKLPPIREMADHLNVNFHTIRAAYKRLEDNNLIATRRGLGSVVIKHQTADTIITNSISSQTFGVIVPDLGNPFYPAFLSGAARIAQQHHILLITCDSQESYNSGKAQFEMLITKGVDGMLIAPWGLSPHSEEIFKGQFYDFPIPLVFVDRPNIEGYSVLLDAENAGFQATQHLINHHHTDIAIITGNLSVPTLGQVYQGYLTALKDNNLPFNPDMVYETNEFSFAEGYRCTQMLINGKHLPSAVFTAGDMFAVGALKALREHHIRVPEDIAIVSYNNIDLAEFTNPSLTSVSTPITNLGEQSAELLFKLVNHLPVKNRNIILPSKLIIRESCGC